MKKYFGIAFFLVLMSNAIVAQKDFFWKDFEKKFLSEIDSNLLACKYETWNEIYIQFLNELKSAGNLNDYNIASIDTNNWNEIIGLNILDSLGTTYHKEAYYPVVNISYEGAVLFCAWLTEKYNKIENRNYEHLQFRLPSEKEWIHAAVGKRIESVYPWHTEYLLDEKGNYLCKFKHLGDQSIVYDENIKEYRIFDDVDNKNTNPFSLISPIDSYNENDFGLYNLSGNVGEMLNEKGAYKGGHWNLPGGNLKVIALGQYQEASPFVGFRFFADIIK